MNKADEAERQTSQTEPLVKLRTNTDKNATPDGTCPKVETLPI